MAKIGDVLNTLGKEMILPFISDLIALGITGKGGKGKILTAEAAQAIVKKISPRIFGLGLADEALFSAALAKLEDRRNLEISRFLETLSDHDKARFILAITLLPEEKDRITVLNWYSELTQEEMAVVAKATHMIIGSGTLKKMGQKTKIAAITIGKFMAGKFWPLLQKRIGPELDRQAKALAQGRVKNPSRFGRLANKLFR